MTKYPGRIRAKASAPSLPRQVDRARSGGHSPEEERLRQQAFGRSRVNLPEDDDTPEHEGQEAVASATAHDRRAR